MSRIARLLVLAPALGAAGAHLEYETKTILRLPLRGAWTVVGQRSSPVDGLFGIEFAIVRGGATHEGDGTRNTDYYCYGQSVVAPADGVVVGTVDGLAENQPRVVDFAPNPLGNHVVLDHGDGEYSFLAHLKTGSVKVKPGDRVKMGDPLGSCGNSGQGSEPCVHYVLRDSSRQSEGKALPATFRDYIADGKPVERGEPWRGQVVEPARDR